jgi:hypothetical protein
MATTVIGGMLAATIIGILLILVTYYVVERFAANCKQRALHGVPRPREHFVAESSVCWLSVKDKVLFQI